MSPRCPCAGRLGLAGGARRAGRPGWALRALAALAALAALGCGDDPAAGPVDAAAAPDAPLADAASDAADSGRDLGAGPDAGADAGPDTTAPAAPLYHVAAGLLRTADGHVLTLRGINYSGAAKSTPDHLFPVDDANLAALLGGGVNHVRMLTFWNAVAPDGPEDRDTAYLAALAERVDALTAAGLYVVMDMHQDVWGEPFAPHGAPAWACAEEHQRGYVPTTPWWANYATEQVVGCFDDFWASAALRAAFIDAWAAVAGAVCHNPRVVGWDLMNEPFPGTPLLDPRFDNEVLLPFYQEVATAIDAVCPGRLHFMEHSAGAVLGMAEPLEIPADWVDRVVIASHWYPQEIHEPDGPGYDQDPAAMEARVLALYRPHLDAGVAVWVGEFGGMTGQATFGAYMEDLHAIFAKHRLGSALWDFDRSDGGFAWLDASGVLKPVFQSVYGTPTPTLLPGPPTRWVHDWAARRLEIDVTCAPARGVTVHLPAAACSCQADPAGALGAFTAPAALAPGPLAAACTGAQPLTLTCSCPL